MLLLCLFVFQGGSDATISQQHRSYVPVLQQLRLASLKTALLVSLIPACFPILAEQHQKRELGVLILSVEVVSVV